jgi:hypothetical protein
MIALSPMGRAALAYAERFGFHVFPIKPGTKHPHPRFVRHGHREATTDVAQIRIWWEADPDAGVAVACVSSGLVVLDADLYKDECEFPALERRLGTLPQTPRVLSQRGGVHYYYKDTVGAYVNPCPGAESKHKGYVLAPPTPGYRWDLGAHILETPIAELPDKWLRHLTTTRETALPSSGIDARNSYLGIAFEHMGWLGAALPDGRRMARCPWAELHTDGRGFGQDTSSILFPRAVGSTFGSFFCSHSHCSGRTWRDVLAILPPRVRWAADQVMNAEKNARAYAELAAMGRPL